MTYVKTTWETGDVITAEKLNNIEDGIASAGGSFDLKGYLERTITEAVIPEDVTSIGAYAFYECSSLTSVDMPNVTSIVAGAFSGCSSLTSVDMPNVTSIGAGAFSKCSSLTSVDMPNVTSIGAGAFSGCSSLTSVDMPNVTSIEAGAFSGCSSLTSVTINNVTPPTLGISAFNNKSANLKIYVPASAVDTYKADSGWSSYADKIEAIQE